MNEYDAISRPIQGPAPSEYDAISRPDRRKPVQVEEKSYDPRDDLSGFDKFAVSAGHAMTKGWHGLTDLGRRAIGLEPDKADADEEALFEKYKPQGWQATAGDIAGGAAIRAPLALIPGGILAQAAIQGAGEAALTPGDLAERAKAGGMGAAGGAVGGVLTKTLGRLAKPVGDKADDIKALEALGVEPTFGQSVAANGTALGRSLGRLEETATSVPIGGGPLRATREKAVNQWRQASRDAALPPGPGGPAKSIDDVFERIGDAYSAHLDPLPMPYQSVQYQPDMHKLSAGIAVTPEQRQLVQETFEQTRLAHLANPAPGVQPTAAAAQQIESAMKRQGIEWLSTGDPAQRAQGKLFMALAKEYGNTWRGALPPGVRAAVKQIDNVYPNALALAKAGASTSFKVSGGIPENYTPAVLSRAARAMDRTPNKRVFNRGEAPQQEMSRLGGRLMPEVSDSGSPERGIALGMLAGLGSVGNIASLGAPALYGTRPVQQWLTGRGMPKTQEALLRALRRLAPYGAATGASAADNIGDFNAP